MYKLKLKMVGHPTTSGENRTAYIKGTARGIACFIDALKRCPPMPHQGNVRSITDSNNKSESFFQLQTFYQNIDEVLL